MLKLENIADLQALVTNQVMESTTLEYKASPAVAQATKEEIAKDISAMANADGGQFVYGMEEVGNLPAGLDAGINPKPFDGLWFEQVIQQNVRPQIEGLKIFPLPLSSGNYIAVITVPRSRTVHQAKDGRYYRRRNFRNDIMEDYAIREAMTRNTSPELISILRFHPTRYSSSTSKAQNFLTQLRCRSILETDQVRQRCTPL
jgi:predicted HTH transcriptional regulator